MKTAIDALATYADDGYSYFQRNMGFGLPTPNPSTSDHDWQVLINESDNGFGGSAGPSGIGLTGGAAKDGYIGHLFVAHEMANVFTGQNTPGWPWANGSYIWAALGAGQYPSPFPRTAATAAMLNLGYTDYVNRALGEVQNDAGFQLLYGIIRTYGWTPFEKLFSFIKSINLNLSSLLEPLKTGTIMVVMTVQTGTDFITQFNQVFQQYGVGIGQNILDQAQVLLSNPPPPTNGGGGGGAGQYNVCTYVNPGDLRAQFTLGGSSAVNGGLYQITPGQTYNIAANPPSGYSFERWEQSDGVHVTDLNAASTTATFDSSSRPTCVGNLSVHYILGTGLPPSQYKACTYANPTYATFLLGGVPVNDGGLVPVVPNSSYTLRATPPSGLGFLRWRQSDGVHISDPAATVATVTFDANTRSTCVGNLSVDYGLGGIQPPTEATVTATAKITGGFPIPSATLTLFIDNQPSTPIIIPQTETAINHPITRMWTVQTGHTVRVRLHLENPLGTVDLDSQAVAV